MPKERLDKLLADRGLVASRSQAQPLIIAGLVRVNGQVVSKAGEQVAIDAKIDVRQPEHDFVSRGGGKLAGALNHFNVDVNGYIALDCGVSTGGFTDCLLKRGAKHVYGVDVGYGDVAWSLRNHPSVTLIERTNIRYLLDGDKVSPELKERLVGAIDLVTLDLSFISVTKVLAVVSQLLRAEGLALVLVKPQFELQKRDIGKGGIVRDPALHRRALDGVSRSLEQLDFKVIGEVPSEVVGSKGNQEFFLLARKPAR